MSLVRKTLRSALWVAARFFARQFVNTVLFFWLAAILSPDQLGVASLGVTLALFFMPVVSRGVRDMLIQRPTLDDTLLDTAFALNVSIGAALSLGLAILSLFSGSFFDDSRIVSLSLVSSLIPLLVSIGSPIEAVWERGFEHKKIMLVYTASSFFSGILAVSVALSPQPVWALVTYNVSTFFTSTVIFIITGGWRPKSLGSFQEMVRQVKFITPIVISQTISAGNQRIVELIVGIVLSPSSVAFFRFAGNFIRLMNQFFMAPVLQVLLPAFSASKQSADIKLTKTLAVNSFIIFPVFLGSATIIPELIVVVFGDKWEPAGWVAAILCYGVFSSLIGPIAYPLLISEGKPFWPAFLTFLALFVTIPFVTFGASLHGVIGGTIGFVARGFVTIPLTLYIIWRALRIPPVRVISAIAPFAIAAASMNLFIILVVSPLTGSLDTFLKIPIKVISGISFYFFGVRFLISKVAPQTYQMLRGIIPDRIIGALY